MKRIASVMYLHPNNQAEYKKRHDELWPEMAEELKNHGATNYSIFLDEATDTLFAYLEVADEQTYNQISETEICRKWWAYMAPIMKSNSDNSPVSKELKEVFYLK